MFFHNSRITALLKAFHGSPRSVEALGEIKNIMTFHLLIHSLNIYLLSFSMIYALNWE